MKKYRFLCSSMRKNKKNIPVNSMADNSGRGIAIDVNHIKKADFKTAEQYEEATQSHRDEGHTFHLVQKGKVLIEIDLKKHTVSAPAVVYMHPSQVHRIIDFHNVTVCSLAINNEHLYPDHQDFLETIAPVAPLSLSKATYKNISTLFTLSLDFYTQKNNKLYQPLLKDSCNALVALIASVFLQQHKGPVQLSRSEHIARSFAQLLEKHYSTVKRPAVYADKLNISTHYLNESVKHTTGIPVTQHIRDRVILEAKRLLLHTDRSVKEIAFELGYEDYPYFTRLFTKATGITALTYRSKRHD
ncbi:helix-turn-helix domain-containing protein [Ferruginibacter sp.]